MRRMSDAIRKWAESDSPSVLARKLKELEAEEIVNRRATPPNRERGIALMYEIADLKMALSDARKNARGPRTKANGAR